MKPMMPAALSMLAMQQAWSTPMTMDKVKQFFDYLANYQDSIKACKKSYMRLVVHSDVGI